MARLLPVLSVLLWDIQQRKLRLSPFEQHGVAFSFVVAEGYILTVDVPVTSFLIKVLLGIVLLPNSFAGPTL